MERWPSPKRTVLPPAEGSGPKILIVDDQRSNVRLLEHTLRRAGYTDITSTLASPEVAGLQKEHGYDVILLDLQMPDMDGFAVMQALTEIRKTHRLAILVISADPAAKHAALSGGADAFLGKPFRLPEVVEQVRLLLSKAGFQDVRGENEIADSHSGDSVW
jgi:CheY-like chemotaxis protein